ncbi:hypothetical protein CBJ07_20025 [Salmonella enterica]|nr:hypothetical protein [Salmonella enterica]
MHVLWDKTRHFVKESIAFNDIRQAILHGSQLLWVIVNGKIRHFIVYPVNMHHGLLLLQPA